MTTNPTTPATDHHRGPVTTVAIGGATFSVGAFTTILDELCDLITATGDNPDQIPLCFVIEPDAAPFARHPDQHGYGVELAVASIDRCTCPTENAVRIWLDDPTNEPAAPVVGAAVA